MPQTGHRSRARAGSAQKTHICAHIGVTCSHVSLPNRDSGIFLFPFSGWDSLGFDFVLFLSGIGAPPFLALCCPQFSVLKSQEALVGILPEAAAHLFGRCSQRCQLSFSQGH